VSFADGVAIVDEELNCLGWYNLRFTRAFVSPNPMEGVVNLPEPT
jgi:hypothetical protein